jgi:hypothetical protein
MPRDYARVLDTARRLGVKLGPGAHINAPYSFVVDGTLVAAKDWAGSPLNRTVGAEREVPPHALGGYYVEGRTPFSTIDGWLQPDAAAYDVSLAEWLQRQGASPAAKDIIRSSQGRPPEQQSVLRMMQEATRGRIGLAKIDPETMKGKDQYERLDSQRRFFQVQEKGLSFLVNFEDYLDTGLFLDHRTTRMEVQRSASRQRVLNLFCYTGAFSVHAAGGGAAVNAMAAATAGIGTGIAMNKVGDEKSVFLNSAGTWNANNTGNLTASGVIVLKWTDMGA